MSRTPRSHSYLAAIGFFTASLSLFAASLAFGQTAGAGAASDAGSESTRTTLREAVTTPTVTTLEALRRAGAAEAAGETSDEAGDDAAREDDGVSSSQADEAAEPLSDAGASDISAEAAADGTDGAGDLSDVGARQNGQAQDGQAQDGQPQESRPQEGQRAETDEAATSTTDAEANAETDQALAIETSPLPATNPARPARTLTPAASPQTDRIRQAGQDWQARETTTYLGEAGRITVVYGQAQPALVCNPRVVCTVELEIGEVLQDTIAVADVINWQVMPYQRSTADGDVQYYISVTPTEFATDSSMLIITDRRAYAIDLIADPVLRTPFLSFAYPDSAARAAAERTAELRAQAASRQAAASAARAVAVEARGVPTARGTVPAEELDFAFRVSGRESFTPTRVYTDGRNTYVDLPSSYRGEIPVPIANSNVANGVFNYRVEEIADGRRMVLDNVIPDFDLQVGRDVVRIRKAN